MSDFDLDAWLSAEETPAETLASLLACVEERSTPGHPLYYRPFLPAQRRALVRHYCATLPSWVGGAASDGGTDRLVNEAGTPVADGWVRLVVGDYGAFVELSAHQFRRENFTSSGMGNAYTWLRSKDRVSTKVYEQHRGVRYADYRPGFFYVAPNLVTPWPS